jgi:ADP-heptose:LPS heptosyltransferase
MSKHPKINHYRRKIMKSLTKSLGKKAEPKLGDLNNVSDVKRVLIVRTNHRLGNLLLITPLIQEVIKSFPNAKIDLIIQGGLGPVIFENYKQIDRIISLPKKPFKNLTAYIRGFFSVFNKTYDFAINAVAQSSSGKLYTTMAKSKFKVFGVDTKNETVDYDVEKHIAKAPVIALRNYLEKMGFDNVNAPMPNLDLILSKAEIKNGQEILEELIGKNKKIVSLFTFATGDKCYKPEWWIPFYEKLLKEFPDYLFIEILPYENVSQIDFKAPSFYSKDIREMAAVINNTDLWIGADSGIMHLASAARTHTVGLFSRTNYDVYKPYNGNSYYVYTTNTNIDSIIDELKNVLL